MKIPKIIKLNVPALMSTASKLPTTGRLAVSDNNLTYLDVDDEYVHQLFPLLDDRKIRKPDYFGPTSAGAHISVIYPEENRVVDDRDTGQQHHFKIKDAVVAEIRLKKYYVLLVESPSLQHLRSRYALSDVLCFKGYSIGFHITIGVNG